MTQARIDAITRAILASGYFFPMASDYKIFTATWGGSMTPPCEAPPADVDTALSKMSDLVNCVMTANPALNNGNTILNVFLPPQTINTGFCNVVNGAHATAEHDKWGVPVTVNPTISACNASFNILINGLSHEMVESATDPVPASPTGFKTFNVEIGDLCENTHVPFLFSDLTKYWSNGANSCVNGVGTTTPAISSTTVCGTGKHMRIALMGSFEGTPWDLSGAVFGDQTLYLQAAVSHGTSHWSAGNIDGMPTDSVVLSNINWRQDSISIGGFGAGYGNAMVVAPGDTVTLKVFSVATGLSATGSVTAPGPSALTFANLTYMLPGASQTVTGSVVDSSSCTIEATPVSLSATAGTVPTATTNESGMFSSAYTAGPIAGLATITGTSGNISASVTVPVLPNDVALSTYAGSVTGGQRVTLTGAGFDSSTTIYFGGPLAGSGRGSEATVNSVASDHHSVVFTTPLSPLGGDGTGVASVTAVVNGMTGAALNYRYIVPGRPVLVTDGDYCKTQPVPMTVTVFNDDGSVDHAKVDLKATYPAFVEGKNHVDTLSVKSGSTFYVVGSGSIVATNPANKASTTFYFTICPFTPPKKILAHFNQFYIPETPISGAQVVWFNGINPGEAGDFVIIPGVPAQLSQAFNIRQIGSTALQQLIDNGATIFGVDQKTLNAAFTGKAIDIVQTGKITVMPGKAMISFVRPAGSGVTYQIVHLAKAGETMRWVVVKGVHDQPGQHLVSGPVTDPGAYALVAVKQE